MEFVFSYSLLVLRSVENYEVVDQVDKRPSKNASTDDLSRFVDPPRKSSHCSFQLHSSSMLVHTSTKVN